MAANHSIPEDKPRRTLIIVVAVIAAVVIGGVFYLLMRETAAPEAPATLADAIRAGSPEFEQYRAKIALDKPEAIAVDQRAGWISDDFRNDRAKLYRPHDHRIGNPRGNTE